MAQIVYFISIDVSVFKFRNHRIDTILVGLNLDLEKIIYFGTNKAIDFDLNLPKRIQLFYWTNKFPNFALILTE